MTGNQATKHLQTSPTALARLRVLEVVDDMGELCGKMLADMGATVTRVEPPDGSATRRIWLFLEDKPHPERSLHTFQTPQLTVRPASKVHYLSAVHDTSLRD